MSALHITSCLDLLRPKRCRQKISPVLIHQPGTMAQLQAWCGAHLDAMGAYDLRPAVPLLVSPEQIPYQVPVAPRATHAHDDVGPRVPFYQGRTGGCLAPPWHVQNEYVYPSGSRIPLRIRHPSGTKIGWMFMIPININRMSVNVNETFTHDRSWTMAWL